MVCFLILSETKLYRYTWVFSLALTQIQWTYNENTVNIQWKPSNLRWKYSEHTMITQWTYNDNTVASVLLIRSYLFSWTRCNPVGRLNTAFPVYIYTIVWFCRLRVSNEKQVEQNWLYNKRKFFDSALLKRYTWFGRTRCNASADPGVNYGCSGN